MAHGRALNVLTPRLVAVQELDKLIEDVRVLAVWRAEEDKAK